MKQIKRMFPFQIVNIFAFYCLPMISHDTDFGIALLLLINPCICMITSLSYSLKYGFRIAFSAITVLFFIPTIYMYYNESAAIYIVVYFAFSFVCSLAGLYIQEEEQNLDERHLSSSLLVELPGIRSCRHRLLKPGQKPKM